MRGHCRIADAMFASLYPATPVQGFRIAKALKIFFGRASTWMMIYEFLTWRYSVTDPGARVNIVADRIGT